MTKTAIVTKMATLVMPMFGPEAAGVLVAWTSAEDLAAPGRVVVAVAGLKLERLLVVALELEAFTNGASVMKRPFSADADVELEAQGTEGSDTSVWMRKQGISVVVLTRNCSGLHAVASWVEVSGAGATGI